MPIPSTGEGGTSMPTPRLRRRRDDAALARLAEVMRLRGAHLADRHIAAAGLPNIQPDAAQQSAQYADLAAELVVSFEAVRSSWPTHGSGSRVLLRAFFDGYRSAGGPARLTPPR